MPPVGGHLRATGGRDNAVHAKVFHRLSVVIVGMDQRFDDECQGGLPAGL